MGEPDFVLGEVPSAAGHGIRWPDWAWDREGNLSVGPSPWSDVDLGQPGRAVAVLCLGRGG